MRTRLTGLLVALGLLLAACGGGGGEEATQETVPVVTTPTSEVSITTTSLPPGCGQAATPAVSYTAQVVESVSEVAVFDAPNGTQVSSMENPRLINGDPNAAVPTVFLVKDAPTTDDCEWVEVYLPVRPNGSSGWVKRSDLQVTANPYRLVADLANFTLTLYKDGNVDREIDIAVASDNTPTPGGLYYITELVQTPEPGGAYGPYAYGLSGFSEVHQTFNGGPGQLGIHGTNQPQLIGTKVSNGCIRMRNEDITALAEVLPLGVPVEVTA